MGIPEYSEKITLREFQLPRPFGWERVRVRAKAIVLETK
jgi:hypothetical protein